MTPTGLFFYPQVLQLAESNGCLSMPEDEDTDKALLAMEPLALAVP